METVCTLSHYSRNHVLFAQPIRGCNLEQFSSYGCSPGTLDTWGDGNVGTLDVPPGHKWSLCIHGAWHYKWQSVCRKVIYSKTLSTLL